VATWAERVDARLDAVRAVGRWRSVRELADGQPATFLGATGAPVVNFASNDYLGLSQHPAVRAAAHAAIDRYGTGSGASRLVVGARPVHRELEEQLAAWKGTEAALLLPSGYQANLAVLTSLASDPDVVVCSDELNHASIVDGARLARGRTAVYGHVDVDHLDALLTEAPSAVVVTDTVFSMDGDVAPLDAIAASCAQHGAVLVLDEAHAVLGPSTPRLDGLDVLVVGTLSKALGAVGGFVAGPRRYIDLLVNVARPFIFTTAPAPPDVAAASAALAVVTGPEGDELRARLRGHIDRLAPGRPAPIVPVVLGDEERALAASLALLERGLLVPAIRPPTVPPGTSRLRVTLSAAHTVADVDHLVAALADLDAPVGDAA
jgi:8-amino-7-oxononanoate synthase